MNLREVVGSAAVALVAFTQSFTVLLAQQETSALVVGVVSGGDGRPIGSARVALTQRSVGAVGTTQTNAAGLFSFGGLPVGGPYTLTVDAADHEPLRIDDIYLGLGETRALDLVLPTPTERTIRLDTAIVIARREDPGPGARTTLSQVEIDATASVENSLNEFAALDPRITHMDPERGELAAAGQNSRYNSLSIDGVRINDMFGVEDSGFPSQGNPLALETIEAISIETSPYDVQRGGFVGAAMNAVTKSGSNRFRGSLYYTYRDEKWRAKHPITGERSSFTDQTIGATLGGPLLRDQLFFFASYEHSQRIEPAPAAGFQPTGDALARIVDAAASYGYDPGALENPGQQNKEDHKYLAKFDWRITERHRASLRFSETLGHRPVFTNYSTSGRVSLSDHWYDNEQNLTAWSGQLFSRWSPQFQSEMKIAAHRYDSRRSPRTRFPQVRINGVAGEDGDTGSVFIGADYSSQLNVLAVENLQAGAAATWLLGRHRVLLGVEMERSEFENTFLQNAFGSYTFASINAFATGRPSTFTHQYALPGRTPGVAWNFSVGSAFLQDSWLVTRRLTVAAGLRLDYPFASSKPHYNPAVEQALGQRNDRTFTGAYTLAPRTSFIFKFDAKGRSRLRGGAGVFQGRAPGVWLSNPYLNDGSSLAVNTQVGGFSPDPDRQPQGNPVAHRERVDLIARDFHLPSVARANLAYDQRLPWQNLMVSAEILQTWAVEALTYKNINLRRTGTGPDGRAIYGDRTRSGAVVSHSHYISPAFTDVYMLTNTSKGRATQATISLRRPLKKYWGASIAYTRTRADEVSPMTSSTAATTFSTRLSVDPNDDQVGTANYEVRDRVLANLTLRVALVRRFETRITLAYEGRSGRPYSFIFGTDVNGDSSNYDNDLFYVPAGRDDPRVRFADPRQVDPFFAYLDSNPALKRFAGRIVPRNSERSQYQHRVDLRFTQDIPFWRTLKAELFCSILNLANLLDDERGRVNAVGFPYGLPVANASYDPVANQYVYRFTGAKTQTLQPGLSRWQLQGGVRLKF